MTVVLEDTVTVQSTVPEHPPLQFVKMNPGSAVARNVTFAPVATSEEQVEPQSIPADALAMLPRPFFVTMIVAILRANFAVQLRVAFIVTEPSEQSASPVHPANVEFAAGIAVNVTTCPDA